MKIALFDMDGVLLASHGYHRALQDTVRIMALSLGFPEITLTPDEIAAFESAGMTSEWDEAAVSTALLQLEAWRQEDGHPSRSDEKPWPRPDFNAFAFSLVRPEFQGLGPLERAARAIEPMLAGLETSRREHILSLVANARQPLTSHTHRLLQEMVLGSTEFRRIYGLEPEFQTESYLLLYDTSYLDGASHKAMVAWLSQPGNAAAILTSRPSRPPEGFFGTPEAEYGAQLVGLPQVPIAGWGGITWMSARQAIEPQSILKPDSVHALAAIQMALGEGMETAFQQAYSLSRSNPENGDWLRLDGAEILVFEDAPNGLLSGRAAQAVLAAAGIQTRLSLHGITAHPVKRQALAAAGAQVHATLPEALHVAGLAYSG